MRTAKRPWIISLLLLGHLWLAGCQNNPLVVRPDATTAVPTAVPDSQTAMPTAIEPATPAPELPAGPYPPRIVTYEPRSGEAVPAGTMLRWVFDQVMDRESFAAGLHISPPLAGELVWQNLQEVTFEPDTTTSGAPVPGTRYSIIIDATQVTSVDGLPMGHDLRTTFSVLSPLQVTWVSPVDGAIDLRGDALIMVEFNHEIVPEVCVGRDAVELGECQALPLTFSPTAMGMGTWVNTSLYRYEVLGGFTSGVVHEVVLDSGVTSLDGAVLAEPYGWSFMTAAPQVLDISPASGQDDVALDTEFRIVFNTPMDVQSTGGAFTVMDADGAPVAGAVTWRDNGAELIFSPIELLESDTVYIAQIGERARAVRSTPLVSPLSWGVRTVPEPSVLSHIPDDGDEDVDLDTPVRISFAGAIDAASLAAGISVSSSAGLQDVFSTYDAKAGVSTLMWDRLPRTEYCATVTNTVTDEYGRALISPADFCFETGDLPEVLAYPMDADVVALTADRPSTLNLVAQNVSRAEFVLSAVDVPVVTGVNPDGGEVIREWRETFDPAPNAMEPVTITLRRLSGTLPNGLYRLAWQLPGADAPEPPVSLAVVDRHVVVKLSESEAMVWITDLSTGAPVTRTEVQLLDADGLLIAGGTTDADGLARLPRANSGGLDDVLAVVTGQPGAAGYGFALATSRNTIVPWQFGILADLGLQLPYRAFVHTDRPAYAPGQRVQLAGFVREDLGGEYRPPRSDEGIMLTLRGPDEVVVEQRSLSLSETGRFDTAVFLPEWLTAGAYTVEFWSAAPDQNAEIVVFATATFTIVPNRDPDLALHVTAETADILGGAEARFIVQTDDLAGDTVPDVRLTWTVYAEPYAFEAAAGTVADGWVWQSSMDRGAERVVAQGTAVADAAGRYVIELPATLASSAGDDATMGTAGSEVWRVEVVANAGASGDVVAVGTAAVTVHASEQYLGLLPKSWVVRVKERLAIDLLMVDWLGEGIGQQTVRLQLDRRTWTQRPEDGAWVYTDTMVSEQTVTTSDSGRVSAAFTAARSGSYVVKAVGMDATGGNTARVEVCLWVGGSADGDALPSRTSLTLIADQPSYQAGEVARILVPISFEGPYTLLLTVERDGVLAVERFAFEDPNPILEIPVLGSYVPNVYVSCVLLRPGTATRGPQVYVGYLKLPVVSQEQTLTVEVLPTGTRFAAGDTTEVLIRTQDSAGQPVSADVTLAVVQATGVNAAGGAVAPFSDALSGERSLRVLTGDVLLAPGNAGPDQPGILACMVPMPGVLAEATTDRMGSVTPELAHWDAALHTDAGGEVTAAFTLPEAQTTWDVTAWAVTEDSAAGCGQVTLSTEKPLSVQLVAPSYFVAGDRSEIVAAVRNATGDELVTDVELSEVRGLVVDGIATRRISLAAGETKRIVWPVSVVTSGVRTATARVEVHSGDTVAFEALTDSRAGTAGLPIHYVSPLELWSISGVLDAGKLIETIDVPETAGDATELVVRIDATLSSLLADSLADRVHTMALAEPDTTGAWVDDLLPAVSSYGALLATEREQVVTEAARLPLLAALDRIYARQNVDGGWGWGPASVAPAVSGPSDFDLTCDVVYALLRAEHAGLPVRDDILEAASAWIADALADATTAGVRHAQLAFAVHVLSEARQPWPPGVGAALYAARDDLGWAGRAHLALAFGLVDASDTRVKTLLDELRAGAIANATGSMVYWEELERAVASSPATPQGLATPTGPASPVGPASPAGTANPAGTATPTPSKGSGTSLILSTHMTHVQVTALVLDAFGTLAGDAAEIPGAIAWLMSTRQGAGWQTSHETAWALTALADIVAHQTPSGSATPGLFPLVVRLNGVAVPVGEVVPPDDGTGSNGSWTLRLTMDDTAAPALQPGRNVLEILRSTEAQPDTGEAPFYVSVQLDVALPTDARTVPESRGLTLSRRYCAPSGDTEGATARGREICVPVSSAAPGDLVVVHLLVTVPERLTMVRLEDPLPAGFRPIDVASSGSPMMRVDGATFAMQDAFLWGGAHDDRAVFMAPALYPGTYDIEYVIEAVLPGSYTALPAVAREVTFADIVARSTVTTLTINGGEED